MSNYYLHRISYYKSISSPLLEKENYLSIGGFANLYGDKLYDIVAKKDKNAFNKYLKEKKSKFKSVPQLWRFLNFKKDDLIIVPNPYGKKFSIYKIIGDKFLGNEDKELSEALTKLGLNNLKDEKYILGYFWKVESVAKDISKRDYADNPLMRIMRYRGTNVVCNDKLKKSIDDAINNFKEKKPINLFLDIVDSCCDNILKLIREKLDDAKFEKLIKLYFKQCGANDVYKPSKTDNDEGDCDVEALFEPIKTIIHVQAKAHKGYTNEWAIRQINEYIENETENNEYIEDEMEDNKYIHIGWVISTCDDFSNEAKKLADKNNILLINGETFAEMLIRSGIHTIDKNL